MFVLGEQLFVTGRRMSFRDAHMSQGCRFALCLEGDGFVSEVSFGQRRSGLAGLGTRTFKNKNRTVYGVR